jgi:hypothetical protein
MLRVLLLTAHLWTLIFCDTAHSEQAVQPKVKPIAMETSVAEVPKLDTGEYEWRMKYMLNGDSSGRWPAKAPHPRPGAILPFKRIIAYYGNLYSTRMGILGELPKPQMFAKLKEEVRKWEKADPKTPVQPALHYIAVTAQGSPGANGLYRLRMPFKQIDTVVKWAKEIDALVFLDVQVGLSTIQKELPEFEPYLKLPNVHFGIDPEFSMKGGEKPGSAIGTYDAADINFVVDYLSDIVKKYNLPPKVLVIHRFTQRMVTNYKSIKKTPEVQIVMHMDGWGSPERKLGTYKYFIQNEPVQFTGFKIFYKNDLKHAPHRLLTAEELLKAKPRPMYIQYQ